MQRIDEFLAYLLRDRSLSPNTVAAYRNDLLQFADNLDGEQRAIQVRVAPALPWSGPSIASGLNAYFLHLRDRGYSSASIARKMAAVRSFFQYLHRIGECRPPTQPMASARLKSKSRLPRTASETGRG